MARQVFPTVSLSLRLPAWIVERLREDAERETRNVNTQVTHLLRMYYEEEEDEERPTG